MTTPSDDEKTVREALEYFDVWSEERAALDRMVANTLPKLPEGIPPDIHKLAEELAAKLQVQIDDDYTWRSNSDVEKIITQALTQSYERGASDMREEAAKLFDSEHNAGQTIARTIRSLPLSNSTVPCIPAATTGDPIRGKDSNCAERLDSEKSRSEATPRVEPLSTAGDEQ